MRILWHSNSPLAPTGYGSQTALFTPLIRDAGHDVAISAFWGMEGRAAEWHGMTVYPGDGNTGWGQQWLPAYAAHHGDGDPSGVQVITLMDVWVLGAKALRELRVASWVPIDHAPAPPAVAEFFRWSGSTPIAMSQFGVRMLQAEGLDPLYVPHGIDTNLLRPLEQKLVREAMGLPEDAFVVGMVAANKSRNPSRKGFPQAFEAFGRFHKEHPESLLYLHTTKDYPQGLNLEALATRMGVPLDALRWTPEFELQMGVEYEKLAWVYSNMDVLLNPSYGEGFGIPIVEAQACGVPVIVNDFSAMSELVGAGWKTPGWPTYNESQGAWWQSASVDGIVDGLREAYASRGQHTETAREFALGYDTRHVMDTYWKPVLEQLGAPREVPPLMPANRKMRRAKQRTAA